MKNSLSALAATLLYAATLPGLAAPTVSLTAPANEALYLPSASITVRATASADPGRTIVRVEFRGGGTLFASDTTAPYSASLPATIPGIYVLTATAIDSAGEETVSEARIITVGTQNIPPTVSLSQPPNNALYSAPVSLTFAVNARAPEANDSIASVEYFLNGVSAGVVTASPWRLVLDNVQPGTYALTATATDAHGGSATSASRSFTVQPTNTPPTVNLTSPPNNNVYLNPVTLDVKANASSPERNDAIAKVEFYANDVPIGTDTTKPYAISWTNIAPGTYTLTAKATDDQGAETVSAARTVTITGQNTPPTVAIASPANNSRYNGPTADVAVRVNASAPEDNDSVQKVELFQDGVLVATLTAAPYTATLSQLPIGTYVLTAVATDGQGGQTTSAGRTVIIEETNRPPSVSLTAPANNSTVELPANITLSANANPGEVNGSIAQVEFLVNGALVGGTSVKPYTTTWTPTAAGTYSLTARATDNLGAVKTSAARTITLTAPPVQAPLTVYYVHVDHLNTPRQIYDQSQQVVWRWDQQEPFGVNVPDGNPSGLGAFDFPQRFPGQYFDRETNLAYNMARDYDAGLGRYIESDPLGLRAGLNTYAYVTSRPLGSIDPSGLKECVCTNMKIKRKNIDMKGEDKYGHWWTEIGNESYGWWPKYPLSGIYSTLTGVEGELNGQTSFHGGTPTRDPHHGYPADEEFNPKTDGDCCETACENAANCFRNFAKSYSGEWRWTFGWGQNCHTFQEAGMEQCKLTR